MWAISLALLVFAGVAGGWFVWGKFLQDQFFPRHWAVVEPGRLYRSGLIAPRLIRGALEEHNIQVVIDLTAFGPGADRKRAEEEAVEAPGIEHLELPLSGSGTGDINHYAKAVAAIVRSRRENKPVLVHCINESRRTGGVLATYQLLVQQKSPEEVYRKLDRHCNSPVAGSKLLAYLNDNMAEIATLLVGMNVIEHVPSPVPKLRPPGSGPVAEQNLVKANDE